MHTFVEVVSGLPVVPDHLVGDVGCQEVANLVEELLILVGQLYR